MHMNTQTQTIAGPFEQAVSRAIDALDYDGEGLIVDDLQSLGAEDVADVRAGLRILQDAGSPAHVHDFWAFEGEWINGAAVLALGVAIGRALAPDGD
jgi:hypothetical protein